MDALTALLILLGVLCLVTLGGVLLNRRAAQARTLSSTTPELPPVSDWGSTATLVQFSTQFCSQCPAMRRNLTQLAARHQGVVVEEVDLSDDAATARRFNVFQTPTVLIYTGTKTLAARYSGPTKPQVFEDHLLTLERTNL